MPGPNINTKIKFDGEKEYKQAISEINSALGVLNSEMRKTSAEFKSNADSIDALNAKNDVLERRLTTQQDKVAKIREALQKAGDAYGEADKRTMAWQKALYDAEAAVAETENAIRENNEAIIELNAGMEETESSTQGLGTMLDSLAGKFGFEIPEGIKSSLDGFANFSSAGVAAAGAVAAAIVAVIKVYKELIDMTQKSAVKADDVLTLAQITGLDAESIQEMQYMAELVDVSFETISGSMTKLINKMQDAAAGKAAAVEVFEQLGVSVTNADGSLRGAHETFNDVITALGDIENRTERDALSMDVFGKSAQDLAPLMSKSTEEMESFAEEAHNVGYVLDEEMLTALAEVDDAEQRLTKTKEALTLQMSAQMAPAVVHLKEEWLEFVTEGGKALIDSHIIEGLGEILKYSTDLLSPFAELILGIPQLDEEFNGLYTILHGVAGVFAWLADAANAFVGVLQVLSIVDAKEGLSRIGTAMGYGARSGNYSNMQQWMGMDDTTGNYLNPETGLWEGNYGHNSTGTNNWRGGLTWVGEAGPELAYLPRGTQIMNAQESRQIGGDVFYITIDPKNVEEFNDIVEIARNARMDRRMR